MHSQSSHFKTGAGADVNVVSDLKFELHFVFQGNTTLLSEQKQRCAVFVEGGDQVQTQNRKNQHRQNLSCVGVGKPSERNGPGMVPPYILAFS